VTVPLLVVPRTASGIGTPGGGGGGGRKKPVRGKDDGKRDGRGVWGGDHDDLGYDKTFTVMILDTILQPILVSQNDPK
jgi:hypothetical protein